MSTKPGFIRAMWDGEMESEEKLKELTGIKSRCILEDADPISDVCMISGKPAKYLVVWGIQY
ncbi:Proline--tRNA ligase [compost metagenome]